MSPEVGTVLADYLGTEARVSEPPRVPRPGSPVRAPGRGQRLGHKSITTTAIYAKLDLDNLAAVAMPLPDSSLTSAHPFPRPRFPTRGRDRAHRRSGGQRARGAGDNLCTCSILAPDAMTGKLKWRFQPTPHDEWDWTPGCANRRHP
ncbi:MAG: hypothetical protein FJW39_29090 [Acidobacteria bacterium]|nr:hypothetical protein [Acidobacteriota bacterium]